MNALSRWLSAKNYRTTVINILMLTGVLAMAGSAGLFKVVGGGAVALAGAYFLVRAISLTVRSWAGANLYQIALIWIPGILALGLAVVGLYGTLAYDVTRRRNEIGIRMALGAAWRDVVRLVLRDAGDRKSGV